MTTKLTLALDKVIVERAKKYASQRHLSLSKLVEFFFASLTTKVKGKDMTISPVTSTLAGMVKFKNIDEKAVIKDALIKKYL